jgi:hypothetical protein
MQMMQKTLTINLPESEGFLKGLGPRAYEPVRE